MRALPVRLFGPQLAFLLLAVSPCLGFAYLNSDELLAQADLVVLGDVVSVEQGVDSTQAQVRVSQVLKGRPELQGTLVLVESGGGRVYIEESEPTWSNRQAHLLFLQAAPDGSYACVNQADGQKRIWGESIYPYHDNQSYAVPFKDYLKALEARVKAAQGKEAPIKLS